jgi:hypothetical protein
MLRFAKEQVNQLWETDLMYGPYVGSKKKQATYLLAYIDDASRLITHAGFYLSQDIASLRSSFKEAVMRRGLPKILYICYSYCSPFERMDIFLWCEHIVAFSG